MGLRQHGISVVSVEGPYNDLIEDEYDNAISDEVLIRATKTVQTWFNNGYRKSLRVLITEVESLVEEILSGKACINNLSEICSADADTFTHCVDVCVLSMTVGLKLGYERKELIRLGLGSIMHDLGKTRIPKNILNKPGKLNEEEFEKIKEHPEHGYKMLQEEVKEEIDPEVLSIVLNHHEKYDGSGYCRGLKGEEIDEKSIICAITDVYNAITTDRVYRKALPPHEAYEMILGAGNTMFDIKVVNAFLSCVVPYPVGSMIKLSNGMVGCVTRIGKMSFRPEVTIISTNETLNLANEKNITIIGVLKPEEARELIIKGRYLHADHITNYRIEKNA